MRLPILVVTASLLWASGAAAQRSDDRTQFDARMNVLQRSMAELSQQVERLKASNQELERKLDAMRTSYNQRLERLEKGPPPASRKKR
jgi:predicted RNase H-like nuclease (RuvC/YqgF family)